MSTLSTFTDKPLSVDQYHKMIDDGVLRPDKRAELIDGIVVDMPPMDDAPRAAQIQMLSALLHKQLVIRGLDEEIYIRSKLPLILNERSEVHPDFVLLREGPPHKEQPRAEDVDLVIEICDSTVYEDRNSKLPRYAVSGVSEVWMFDMRNAEHLVLTVHRRPVVNGKYSNVTELTTGEVQAQRIPELPLDVQRVLTHGNSCGPAAVHRRGPGAQ